MSTFTTEWQRYQANVAPSNSTSLHEPGLIVATATNRGKTLLQTVLDVEFAIAVDTTSGHPVPPNNWWTQLAAVAAVFYTPNLATTPPADGPDANPSDPGWVLWEYLYNDVQPLTSATNGYVVTMRGRQSYTTSKAQRKADPTSNGSLWMAWDILSTYGIINAPGTGYNITFGYKFCVRGLWKL